MAQPVEGCELWQLPSPVTLIDLMAMAVVTAEDLADAENRLKPVPDEDALSTKEKNSMSIIVAALTFQNYGWNDGTESYRGLGDLRTEIESLGMRLSANTIKDVVNQCWQRARPTVG